MKDFKAVLFPEICHPSFVALDYKGHVSGIILVWRARSSLSQFGHHCYRVDNSFFNFDVKRYVPEARAHICQMIYDFPHLVIAVDLRKFRSKLFVLFCFIFLILVVNVKSLQTLLKCYLLEVVFCVRHKRYANSKYLSDVYSANVGVRPKVGQVK